MVALLNSPQVIAQGSFDDVGTGPSRYQCAGGKRKKSKNIAEEH